MSIHPTAVVDPKAEIDPAAEVGPFSVIGPKVRLAEGVVVHSHAVVTGRTEVGAETQIFPFASVGEIPQDLKYAGGDTRVVIGARNTIREHVTIHAGIEQAGGLTTIGDDNLLMVGVHVAHDCQVGSHTIMANNVLLAGHVSVGDYAYLAGASGVQQFVRVGESAMVAGMSGLMNDAAPFLIVQGYPARVFKINRINMERRGMSKEQIEGAETAFRVIFRSGLRAHEAFAKVREDLPDSQEAERMVAFLEKSERGFARRR
ncbi:MAG: acyl-ACP--UDP-N-acetylglucosamine O-acyltransferase [bacterium]|nr:acyl-ACP--UDP-N-acetylglucosamine O-acyltransferase [bacterium]